MRGNIPFRYRMTNCGAIGWVAQNGRYYYSETHPITGKAWAKMPTRIDAKARQLAAEFGEPDYQPQSCLVNVYQGTKQSLGLHQVSAWAQVGFSVWAVWSGLTRLRNFC